jgi:hypothetical protein
MKGAFGKGHKHGRWADKVGGQVKEVPALTAYIFAAATNRSNIHNKTGHT